MLSSFPSMLCLTLNALLLASVYLTRGLWSWTLTGFGSLWMRCGQMVSCGRTSRPTTNPGDRASFQDKSAQGPQRESQASQILSPDLRARLTKDKRCLTQILSCLRILSGSLQLILY